MIWRVTPKDEEKEEGIESMRNRTCYYPGRGPRLMSRLSHVQTLATKTWHFQTFATMIIRRDYRDRSGGGATKTSRLIFGMSRLSRPRVAISRLSRPKNYGATFATEADTARPCGSNLAISRLSRPRWQWRDFPDQRGDGATLKKNFRAFLTEVERARLSRPWWIRRDSGNGATQKATARPAGPARPKSALSRLSPPRWRRRDFPDRGGDGATNNHFYRDRSGSGATFAFRVETARLSRSR